MVRSCTALLQKGIEGQGKRHYMLDGRVSARPKPAKGVVAEVVVTAAEHYAKILGCQYVMLRDPLPGTERVYKPLGFSLAPRRFGVTYYQQAVA
jgi:hypothetical protein